MASRPCAAFLAAILLAPLPALAEEAGTASAPGQTVLVQGKRRPEGAGVSASVETLSLAAYAARALTVAEVLERVAGVEVTSFGAAGAAAFVGVRGAAPAEVLVTLDGVRLNPSGGGGADLGLLPIELLDSVDVIRGSGASRFGADALGGVVAFRSGADEGAVVSADSWGDLRTAVSGSARPGDWRVQLSGRQERMADSWSFHDALRGAEEERVNAGGEALGASFAGDGPLGSGQAALHLTASSLDAGSPGLSEFPTPEARRREALGTLSGSYRLGALEADLAARVDQSGYDDPQPFLGTTPVHSLWRGESSQGSIVQQAALGDSGEISLGADLRGEAISDEAAGFHQRWVVGGHGSLQSGKGSVEGELAIRLEAGLEEGSLLETAALPSAGLVWKVSPAFALRLHGGRAWRLPSFLERWLPDEESFSGNPTLSPEDAWTGDLGAQLGLEALTLEGSLFGTTLREGIVWAAVAPYHFQPVNTGPAWWAGGELSARGRLPGLTAELAWTHLESRLEETGAPLPGRPSDTLFARLAGDLPRLEPFLEMKLLSPRDADFYGNLTVPGSTLLTAGITLHAAPGKLGELSGTLEATNLADTDARDSLFFPQPGRTFWLTLAWRHSGDHP